MEYWGLDIGGANVKIVKIHLTEEGEYTTRWDQVPFPVWLEVSRLPSLLGELAGDFPPGARVAVTTTAELADVFATKREGIQVITGAVLEAFPPERVLFLDCQGNLLSPGDAEQNPLALAAANWVAGARMAARLEKEAIYLDIGSTTTDIIPVMSGREEPLGRSDPCRLAAGELVYTGLIRTPVHQLADRVPLRGRFYRVAPEYFAITADIHLVLGHISPQDYSWPTPDGRGVSREDSCARLARLVCGDLEYFSEAEIQQLARFLYQRQLQVITDGLLQVLSRFNKPLPLLAAGEGAFLVEELGKRLGLVAKKLAAALGPGPSRVLPAWGTAVLLAESQEGVRLV